uniref:Chloroplast protein-transporting ATPase n=1 Tax=Panagrolaimus davidi TaxID=227884 RepID=A0A914R5F3_9BILA
MEFLCEIFTSTGIIFLNSLLLIFEIEGCHIDVGTLKYMIDTVFDSCSIYEKFNPYIFSRILLTTEQENWIDSFFMFNAESALKCRLKSKPEFERTLKEMDDENLKILFTEKLYKHENYITEQELLKLLNSIKTSTNLYPQVKDIALKQWIEKMQEIQSSSIVKSKRWNDVGEKSKRIVLFWCSMLSEKKLIKSENIENIQEKLIDFLPYDRSIVGRFFYRLCDDGNVVNKTTKPLEDILDAALHCLTSASNINNNNECYKVVKELLAPYPEKPNKSIMDREVGDLKSLCKTLNDSEIYKSVIEGVLSLVSNISVHESIKFCAQHVEENYNSEDATLFEKYKEEFDKNYAECSFTMDKDQFLLEIINLIILKKRSFELRDTQKIAILCVLKDYDNETKGIVQQIATGEGKTLIIAVASIIHAFKGHKINIVTSSPILAKRDVSDPPNGCEDLYKAFGLKLTIFVTIVHKNGKKFIQNVI